MAVNVLISCNRTVYSTFITLYYCHEDGRIGSKYVTRIKYIEPISVAAGSAAARLLGLRVRIPSGHECLSLVSVVR